MGANYHIFAAIYEANSFDFWLIDLTLSCRIYTATTITKLVCIFEEIKKKTEKMPVLVLKFQLVHASWQMQSVSGLLDGGFGQWITQHTQELTETYTITSANILQWYLQGTSWTTLYKSKYYSLNSTTSISNVSRSNWIRSTLDFLHLWEERTMMHKAWHKAIFSWK